MGLFNVHSYCYNKLQYHGPFWVHGMAIIDSYHIWKCWYRSNGHGSDKGSEMSLLFFV